MTGSRAPVVVVGGSAAGFAAAQAVRATVDVAVVVVSDEHEVPWDRPPLSKAVLADRDAAQEHPVINAVRLERLGAEVRWGVSAAALDPVARRLGLSSGAALEYSDLVIATGVRPRRLFGAGGGTDGVHVLRTQHDARALRDDLVPGARLVVIGAGFLGLEVAATATALGCDVTVLESAAEPLVGRLGAATSRRLFDLHRERGVEVRTSTGVAGIRREPGSDRVAAVTLTDGDEVTADVVLVAVGCVPNTEWLEGSGVPLADGVVTDPYCRAAPGVWAAGDVAAWPNADLGSRRRVEHRANAGEQGRVAGLNLLAARSGAALQAYAPTPFFWTDQYDVKLQAVGYPETADGESVEPAGGSGFVVRRTREGRLVGALAWNAPKEFVAARRELAEVFAASRRPGAATHGE